MVSVDTGGRKTQPALFCIKVSKSAHHHLTHQYIVKGAVWSICVVLGVLGASVLCWVLADFIPEITLSTDALCQWRGTEMRHCKHPLDHHGKSDPSPLQETHSLLVPIVSSHFLNSESVLNKRISQNIKLFLKSLSK